MKKNIKYGGLFIVIVLSLMLGYATYAEENSQTEGPYVAEGCKLASGCNGPTVCVNKESDENINTTCEASPKYTCYKKNIARCEKQTTGNCGWSNTPELQLCFVQAEKESRDGFMLRNREREEEQKELNEEKKIKRDEFKKEIEDEKNELKTIKENRKAEFEAKIEQIKERREEFKTELENKREEIKTRLSEMKSNFKEDLKKIKDENKKISAEKIVDIIQSLNTKLTNNLADKVDQIENVLVGIESRIDKAESRGLDVSSVKTEVEKAKTAIASARDAISAQSSKVYEVNITDEATLRAEMKGLRDIFTTDIKTVREKVKLAHTAVRDTATTLAKIPKIDEIDEVEVETEVEGNDNSKIQIFN